MIWWLPYLEIDTANRVQNLEEAVCIFHFDNTNGKGMKLLILLPSAGK